MTIQAHKSRIVVSDMQDSVFWVKYHRRPENQLVIFADDTTTRWVNHICILDNDTCVAADKFGNVAVLRLPKDVTDDVEEDPSGSKALWERGHLGGASQKVEVSALLAIGGRAYPLLSLCRRCCATSTWERSSRACRRPR